MKKLIIASMLTSGMAYAASLSQVNSNTTFHTYEFTNTYDLVIPKGSQGETKLWIPLPFNSDYQTVKSIEFEGNYRDAFITENNQ